MAATIAAAPMSKPLADIEGPVPPAWPVPCGLVVAWPESDGLLVGCPVWEAPVLTCPESDGLLVGWPVWEAPVLTWESEGL
jgi:hypothetical protein